MNIAMSFWSAKALLSAVELDLFTHLGNEALTGEELGARVGLHPRPLFDFLDGLVAMGMLVRDGDGPGSRYRNSAEAATFLDDKNPGYIGGFFKMVNTRLFPFWVDLTHGLTTGEPRAESKHQVDSDLYKDPAQVEEFLRAVGNLTVPAANALAERFDFTRYRSVCDVGGATGQLSMALAARYPHLLCTTFDVPVVSDVAQKAITAAGLAERITVVSGDFFSDPLPRADIISMGRILHDWTLDEKMHLIRSAYDALPTGGAFLVMESFIDDARRDLPGLMASLNMLIETEGGFEFSVKDFAGWAYSTGFRYVEVLPLQGPSSVAVAYK